MAGKLDFRGMTAFERGTVLSLLSETYADIWSDKLKGFFAKSDAEVFDNPDTVGRCTFVTCIDNEVAGFASYDPRKGPEIGVIGHNCILPKFQGNGFGKLQINRILDWFKSNGFRKAEVCTGDSTFFEPARRMYESCGMRKIKHCKEMTAFGWKMVHYEIELTEDILQAANVNEGDKAE